MTDVSYESLQSQLGEQKTQITSQRQTIQQQKIAGERSVQSLKRVHPRTSPSVYFGQVKPQIESVKGRLVELGQAEKELGVAEQKLLEQEKLIESKRAEGWQVRKKDGEYEFFKTTSVMRGGVGEPSGDFTIRLHWRTSEGEVKTVLGSASKLESMQQQVRDRGGQILEVESLGGGRAFREPSMRETVGGSFILWEAPPIVKEPIKSTKAIESYTRFYEAIPETPIKKRLTTPTKFAEKFGVPSDVFTEYMTTRTVTTTTREMTQAEITDLLSKMSKEEKIAWYKEHAEFGIEEQEKKSWSEIQKQYPDWDLTVVGTEAKILTPKTDTGQLFKVMEQEYLKSPGFAGILRAGTIGFLSAFRFETIVAGLKEGGPLSGGILGVQPRIGKAAAIETLKWEYGIKDQPPLEKFVGVQLPAYETVIAPFVAGAVVGKGIITLGKLTAGFGKAFPTIAKTGRISLKIATGGLIGYAYAEPTVQYGMGGITTEQYASRVGKLSTQLAFFGLGARWVGGFKPKVGVREAGKETLEFQKFVTKFGDKPIGKIGKPTFFERTPKGFQRVISTRFVKAEAAKSPFKIVGEAIGKPFVVKPTTLKVYGIDTKLGYADISKWGARGTVATVAGKPPSDDFTKLIIRPSYGLVPVGEVISYRYSGLYKKLFGTQISKGIKPIEFIELEKQDYKIRSKKRFDFEQALEKRYNENIKRLHDVFGTKFKEPKTKITTLKVFDIDPYLGYAKIGKYGRIDTIQTRVGPPEKPITGLVVRPSGALVPRRYGDILTFVEHRPITGGFRYKPLSRIEFGKRSQLEQRIEDERIRAAKRKQDELLEFEYEETLRRVSEKFATAFKTPKPKVHVMKVHEIDPYLGYAKVSKYGVTDTIATRVGKLPKPGPGIYTGRQPILRPISALTVWDWLSGQPIRPPIVKEPLFRIFPMKGKSLKFTFKDIVKEPKVELGDYVTRDGQILKTVTKTKTVTPRFKPKFLRPEPVFDPLETYGDYEFVRNEIVEGFGKLTGKPVGPSVKPVSVRGDMLSVFPVFRERPKVKTEMDVGVKTALDRDITQMQSQFPVSIVDVGLKFDVTQVYDTTQMQTQAEMQMYDFKTEQVSIDKTATISASAMDIDSMLRQSLKQITTTTKIKKVVGGALPKTTYELFGHTPSQGYKVKVKERQYFKGKKKKPGRLVIINKRALSKDDAMSLLFMSLDNSAAASGNIMPVDEFAKEPRIKLTDYRDIEHKFYWKEDRFIERRKNQIDTRGEIEGISALGWYSHQVKKSQAKEKKMGIKDERKPFDDIFVLPKDKKEVVGEMPGFNVEIMNGKNIQINKRPLSFGNAEALRGMIIDNSIATSGRIVPANKKAQEPLIDLTSFDDISHKFDMKDNVLIEKPEYRRDTKGEIRGISAFDLYKENTRKGVKKKQVTSRAKKQVDMFDMGMPDMMINMDKVFKGVFDFGF